MLEAGYQLRFGLKAADEIGTIGVLWQNDFDGNFTLDRWLHGAINRAHAPAADALAEDIAANGSLAQILGADLFRGRGWGRLLAATPKTLAGQAHKSGALLQRDYQRHRQSFGDLL